MLNRVEDFITIYLKMVGMEMGLYLPINYTWEPAPVYGWLLLPHNISIRSIWGYSENQNFNQQHQWQAELLNNSFFLSFFHSLREPDFSQLPY